MSKGLNCVIVSGNLGRDPEVRGNGAVLSFSIAVTESRKNKDGTWEDKTEWIPIAVFGEKRVSALSSLLGKGSAVLIKGRIETRKYEKNGEDRYSTSVVADDVILQGNAKHRDTEDTTQNTQNTKKEDYDDMPF